jgi:predicted aspartyl protease
MGQLYVPVTLRNAREYVLARHGHLAADQVHTYETEQALIDTGALHVVLPRLVAEQLGLLMMGWTETTRMANGLFYEADVTEGVYVEILHRQTLVHALVMGDTVLIGALVLEGLDLAVDCKRGQLMPNLGTWDQPVFRV